MARIKKVKVPGCESREDFEAAVDNAARLAVTKEKLVANLKQKHQDLDDRWGAEIKAIDAEIKAAHDFAAPYFAAHAGELCRAGRRSGSTKLANFGVRLGLPTVVKSGEFKRVAWKALGFIFDGIDELRQFVRNQPEVDKESILAVFRDLRAEDPAISEPAKAKKAVLDAHGISMTQSEDFWIEPIADEQVR